MMTQTVNRYTRAGRDGRPIVCPHCGTFATVYHFAWCAITCSGCHRMVDKTDWLIKTN
jgi:ribosomal protein S27E